MYRFNDNKVRTSIIFWRPTQIETVLGLHFRNPWTLLWIFMFILPADAALATIRHVGLDVISDAFDHQIDWFSII